MPPMHKVSDLAPARLGWGAPQEPSEPSPDTGSDAPSRRLSRADNRCEGAAVMAWIVKWVNVKRRKPSHKWK